MKTSSLDATFAFRLHRLTSLKFLLLFIMKKKKRNCSSNLCEFTFMQFLCQELKVGSRVTKEKMKNDLHKIRLTPNMNQDNSSWVVVTLDFFPHLLNEHLHNACIIIEVVIFYYYLHFFIVSLDSFLSFTWQEICFSWISNFFEKLFGQSNCMIYYFFGTSHSGYYMLDFIVGIFFC